VNRIRNVKRFLFGIVPAALLIAAFGPSSTPDYSIQAIRYATSVGDSVADLVIGAPKDEKVDTVFAVWLIRGGGRNILLDSCFHVEQQFFHCMCPVLLEFFFDKG